MTYKKIIIGLVFILLISNVTANLEFIGFKEGQVEEFDTFSVIFIENKNITISQLVEENVKVYNGKPSPEVLENNEKLIYILQHYSPDKELTDETRKNGQKRLTAVVKDTNVEIQNGFIIRTEEKKINTKSLLQAEKFGNREIDILSSRVAQIFSTIREIVFRISDFKLSEDYDRGFYTGMATEFIPEFSEESFVEVVPNVECNKFGFVYYPDTNYNYIDQTLELTKNNGYALGIAYSKYDQFQDSLNNMKIFVNEANKHNITPIVRILGVNWFTEIANADEVVNFIKDLKQETNGKLEYVQIWDKPNIVYGDNDYFLYPQAYADYVIEIKQKLNDPDIKFISASLSIGPTELVEGRQRNSSMEYLNTLLKVSEFWDNIDYWASSAYNKDITQNNNCRFDDGTSMIEAENLCLSSIYAYEKEIDRIYEETGSQVEVFLTDVGFSLEQDVSKFDFLLNHIKEDPSIKGATVFLANGWSLFEETSWINPETKKIIELNSQLDVCS
ncbi:hypothetical protein HN789_01910 [archaeon]|nr:hypothetical protein [archaeon]